MRLDINYMGEKKRNYKRQKHMEIKQKTSK